MGTLLQARRLSEAEYRGESLVDHARPLSGNTDLLSLTQPQVVADAHAAYLAAGADIILTNTFTATAISQAEYGLEHLVVEMNLAAARIARRAADAASRDDPSRPRFVAGSIGPTNRTASISPDVSDPALRAVTFAQLAAAYREQARALIAGGVDAILVETVFDTLNGKAALFAVEAAFGDEDCRLPLLVSMTVTDRSGRTLSGQTPEAFWVSVEHAAPLSIGVNCALGADEMRPYVEALSTVAPRFTSCHPNAGLPNAFGEYEDTPRHMADVLASYCRSGWLNIVGGCCGTTPDHIAAIAAATAGLPPRQPPRAEAKLYLAGLEPYVVGPETNFTLVGERTNITGSPAFAARVRAGEWDAAVEIARQQVDRGANLIDINMDEGLIDSVAAMRRFLNLLAGEPDVARVPFMIDSSRWEVIEAGLACIQGKPVVNSISLKDGPEELARRARTLRRHGAAAVVMAFDERGQADTYARKIAVCERAYRLLVDAGFPAADLIFDPMVLTVGTGIEAHDRYARDFLDAVAWIEERLPEAKTIGGISNVSFAFRGHNRVREAMNAAFLYHAIRAGLDLGIVNAGMLAVYEEIPADLLEAVEDLLLARRGDATERLLRLAETLRDDGSAVELSRPWREGSIHERLVHALVRGVASHLEPDVVEALREYGSALAVIEGPLMDGMNEVGDQFASGRMFLPQVVKSARVMKQAVQQLTPQLEREQAAGAGGTSRNRIVLATVKGDVHDIGKNIVGVVLGCNGFEVVDLGVMVPAEAILDAAARHGADLIGLSGLITPSLDEMVHVAREMDRRGMDLPLLIGGATTSPAHTAARIAPAYRGPVVHVVDASRAAGVARRLGDPAERAALTAENAAQQEAIRHRLEGRDAGRELLSIEAAREARPAIDWAEEQLPVPAFLGPRDVAASVAELVPFIDWTPFFHAWGLRGSHPRILDDHDAGPRARELLADAQTALARLAKRGDVEPRGAYGFFAAGSAGDDIVVFGDESRSRPIATLHTLRQQAGAATGQPRLALADYVAPLDSGRDDYVGVFAVTAGASVERIARELADGGDDYASIMFKALGDRLAEAFAEMLHTRARRDWGYGAEEGLSLEDLIRERYRGIRPAPGYPAYPDHSEKTTLWRLLDVEARTGIRLTETYAMWPASSVCGIYLAHPKARYFSVGPIGPDQAQDYARRKGVALAELRRWLAPHLDQEVPAS